MRHGGDPAHRRVVQAALERIRDRLLDAAGLQAGMTLVDVGTGDGLVAFGAIARIGPSLRVVLTDLSAPLLRHAEGLARGLGVERQCTFLQGSAERLAGIEDGSVDVVALRAVLAYVADKPAALRECHRVLRPGGRVALAEPIFRDQALEAIAMTRAAGTAAPPEGGPDFLGLLQRWKAAQFPSTEEALRASPLASFSERDLVRLAGEAGLTDLHLELHLDVRRSPVSSWEVFTATSPHPWAPPLREILATRFSPAERTLFEQVMRPLVEVGQLLEHEAIAYLTARKPGQPAPRA